jgi:hypothetical protein
VCDSARQIPAQSLGGKQVVKITTKSTTQHIPVVLEPLHSESAVASPDFLHFSAFSVEFTCATLSQML